MAGVFIVHSSSLVYMVMAMSLMVGSMRRLMICLGLLLLMIVFHLSGIQRLVDVDFYTEGVSHLLYRQALTKA